MKPGRVRIAAARLDQASSGSARFAICALAGCTAHRLQINTIRQAQTVTDLEYQQILDNLAMFSLNPAALPSLVTLKTGASQVGDTGSAGFLGTSGLINGTVSNGFFTTFGSSPTLTGTGRLSTSGARPGDRRQ